MSEREENGMGWITQFILSNIQEMGLDFYSSLLFFFKDKNISKMKVGI